MGTIQNAINGAMGAALGSALATEHIVEQSLTKQAEAKEGLINTADETAKLGNEYLTPEERATVMNEDGTVKADEALDLMGEKVSKGINNGSIELQKGQEALSRMKQLRAARAKFKFNLGDRKAFDYQNKPNNKETR